KHIFDSVKHSLRRLGLENIDLLQCDHDSLCVHLYFLTPALTMIRCMHDVFKAGYVRYIGMSSCYARQFLCLRDIADYAINNKLTPSISMQNHHNLLYREKEREMFPTLKHFSVGAIPWPPLARGPLTRMPSSLYTESEAGNAIVKRHALYLLSHTWFEEVAKKQGISMAQVSVAWSLSKDGVSAPIVGTTSLANLEDAIAGACIKLTEEEIKYLEEPYQPRSIMGHW
ncbi:NADP-dependent oxidoreductase domain-containing protein, partial [Mycena polygramma]